MKLSSDRILTTHVGSLPRPLDLAGALLDRDNGKKVDNAALNRRIHESILDIVAKQVELGIDVVNDGEHSKSNFAAYVAQRIGGLTSSEGNYFFGGKSRDMLAFEPVYEENRAMYAARPSRLAVTRRHQAYECTDPITFTGQTAVKADIDNMKAAFAKTPATECFMTALSPPMIISLYPNKYYKSDTEYGFALADAMNVEFKMIVDAGFILQVDDPRLITLYDRQPETSLADYRKQATAYIEIINHSLKGIPEDKIRFHTCYSTNVAPRTGDLELKDYVDLMLTIKAQGYTFEAANPRHDHEWAVFKDVKLPEHKVVIPGMVSHCVALVEHPELVAQRIERYASVVGRERVLASNDCGFATAGAHDEVHPLVAWAKTKALVEGAQIASRRLWGRKAA
jgi:5-methyltetrahydropteroyltriglutamate--homocysteine methyltransferase